MELSLLNNRLLITAKTNSGKSELLKWMLKKEIHKFNKIFVISPTEACNKFYSDIIPSNQIFHEFSEDWLNDLMAKLKSYKQNNKKPYNTLLILDDCASDMHNSKALNKIFVMGRHLGISIVVTLQFLHQAPLTARTNASYLLAGQMNKASVEMLCEEYMMGPIEKKEFLQLYHDSTTDYNFFVICCNSVKNNDLDNLYGKIRKT